MADRELPRLKTRLELDTSAVDDAEKRLGRFKQSVNDPDALKGLQGSLESFEQRADQIGRTWSRNVTLPVVAAGAAATKLATDWNRAFTEMQGLAGVSADEVDGLKASVMELSGETARAPQELAEGLYNIRSSGLEGQAALDVLERSAKSAMIGMADTAVMTDVLTSIMNAYSGSTMTAAEATDYMVGAIAVGKAEPEDMARQMGRLLPAATQLGIGFDELAGSLGFLTLTSGDTALSATQLNGILLKLIRPSRLGARELESVGLSAEKIRKVVAEDGLLAALQLLDKAFEGNSEGLAKVMEDSQGLLGFYSLIREGGAPAAAAIDEVSGSLGALDEQVARVQNTDEFKLQLAMNELRRIGIEVGEQLIPVLAEVAGGLGSLLQIFSSLPAPVQQGLIMMVAFAAAVGPIAKAAGLAASGLQLLLKVAAGDAALNRFVAGLRGLDSAAGSSAGRLGSLLGRMTPMPMAAGMAAGAFAGLVLVLQDMERQSSRTEQAAKDLQATAESSGRSIDEVWRDRLARTLAGADGGFDLGGAAEAFDQVVEKLGLGADDLAQILRGTQEEYDAAMRRMAQDTIAAFGGNSSVWQGAAANFDHLRDQALKAEETERRLAAANQDLGIETDQAAASTADLDAQLAGLTDTSKSATEAVEDQADAARQLYDLNTQAAAAEQGVADALADVATARRAAAGDSDEYRRAQQGVADAERSLADAQRASRDAQVDLTRAREEAADALRSLELSAEGAALSEESARFSLADARKALKEAEPEDRARADLRVRQAELSLREAIQRRIDTEEDLAESQRKGIDGSDQVVAARERIETAAEREQEAQERLGEAHERVAQVQADAQAKVQEATERLTEKQLENVEAQAELIEATDGAASSNQALIEGLFVLAGSLDPSSPLRSRLLDYIEDLNAVADAYRDLDPPKSFLDRMREQLFGPSTFLGLNLPGRAQGGPVASGRSYIVGELGPEIFEPNVSGRIIPNGQPASGGTTVEQHFHVAGQPDQITLIRMGEVAKQAVADGLREAVGS